MPIQKRKKDKKHLSNEAAIVEITPHFTTDAFKDMQDRLGYTGINSATHRFSESTFRSLDASGVMTNPTGVIKNGITEAWAQPLLRNDVLSGRAVVNGSLINKSPYVVDESSRITSISGINTKATTLSDLASINTAYTNSSVDMFNHLSVLQPKTHDINSIVFKQPSVANNILSMSIDQDPTKEEIKSIRKETAELKKAVEEQKNEKKVPTEVIKEVVKEVYSFDPKKMVEFHPLEASSYILNFAEKLKKTGSWLDWSCSFCGSFMNVEPHLKDIETIKKYYQNFKQGKYQPCSKCGADNFFIIQNDRIVFSCIVSLIKDPTRYVSWHGKSKPVNKTIS